MMNWFNSKKKKKSRKRKKASPHREWNPQRTWQGLKWLGLFTGALVLIWAWQAGKPALMEYAAANAITRTPRGGYVTVDLRETPQWMSPQTVTALKAVVSNQVQHDPLNYDYLSNAAGALQACPWVVRVNSVERTAVDRVVVVAEYAEPTAVVQHDRKYYLVDTRGIRLMEMTYTLKEVEAQSFLGVITGVNAPPCEVGQVWPGTDVQAGLKLVEALRTRPYFKEIVYFDVSATDQRNRPNLVMKLTNGGEIHWGLPPGDEGAINLQLPGKLAALDKLYRTRKDQNRTGLVNAGYGVSVQTGELLATPLGGG